MHAQQQYFFQDYEDQAQQLLSNDKPHHSTVTSGNNLIKLNTINPIQINYQPQFIKNDRKTIIHDINILTKRRKTSSEKGTTQERKNCVKQKTIQTAEKELSPTIKHNNLLAYEAIPAPREQLQQMRTDFKNSQEENEEYLKHNLGTVKQKIRNKFLKHRVDFAESHHPRHSHTEPSQQHPQPPHKNNKPRIDKYNHDFEEYLIRKKISKKKSHGLMPQSHSISHRQGEEILLMQTNLTIDRQQQLKNLKINNSKFQKPTFHRHPLYYNNNNQDGSKLIIVNPITPGHPLSKFKNIIIETARRSSLYEADSMLKQYVNRNFSKGRSQDKGSSISKSMDDRRDEEIDGINLSKTPIPSHFIKSPLNYTLFKKQIHKLRKESIGLPLLLDSQADPNCSQSVLEDRINAKKLSAMMTLPSEPEPSPTFQRKKSKKYVVFSKKNIHAPISNTLPDCSPSPTSISTII